MLNLKSSDIAQSEKNEFTRNIEFNDLALTSEDIQKLMGYSREADKPIPQMISDCLDKAKNISEIKCGYIVSQNIETNHTKKSLKLGYNKIEQTFFLDKIIFNKLRHANKIIIFICTAGREISTYSKQLMKAGDLLLGYIVDVIGSEIVERAMDKMQEKIEYEYNLNGLKITNRYSPGYCGWHVAEQQKLFQLLPKNFCDVKLSSSSLMSPAKSISGFIGVGEKIKKSNYNCSICKVDDCIYRRKK